MSAKVPTVVRCSSVVPRSTIATGVDGARPAATSAGRRCAQLRHSHEQDEGALDPRVCRPVDVTVVRRDDGEAAGQPAVRHRDAGGRGHRHGGRDPGHDLDRDAGRDASDGFLAAAAEHVRVAALEPDHPLAFAGPLDQHVVDLLLRQGMRVRRLPGFDDLDVGLELRQQPARAESVDDDDVRLGEQPTAAHRDQPGVARPTTDERDPSGRQRAARPDRKRALFEQQLHCVAQRLRAARVAATGHGDGHVTMPGHRRAPGR